MGEYPHIFQPGHIGKLTSKNRIKYAATETNFRGRVILRWDAYLGCALIQHLGAISAAGATQLVRLTR